MAEMNLEERREAFTQEQNALVQKYGMVVQAAMVPRMVGPQLQVEVEISVQPVAGWVAAPDVDDSEDIDDGGV